MLITKLFFSSANDLVWLIVLSLVDWGQSE